MAANSLWCFLVPLVGVLCTATAASLNSQDEFVKPVPLTRAADVERKIRCPSKERWDKCGALCQRNCTNVNEHPGVCPLPCVPGCVCQPGYVRGANGRCVKSRECPGSKKCPRGERYDECSYLCQKNCTTYNTNEPCNYSCHPGCVCPEGYVRSVFPSGKCIKVEKCPKSGEEDIFWGDEDEDKSSSEEDDSDEDYATEGDEESPFDIFRSYCPKNEEFVKCDAKYEPDCGNTPLSKQGCVSGCRCKSDYVRGPKGTCIKKEECPEKDDTKYPVQRICPKHEYWNRFVAHCQKNCTHPKYPACPRVAVAGCICKRGFLRTDKGKCVPQKRCPKQSEEGVWDQVTRDWDVTTQESIWNDHDDEDVENGDEDEAKGKSYCPPNELFVKCHGHCEPDCKTRTVQNCQSVCVSECRCQSGFVRGPKGDCIKPEKCPAKDKTKYPVKRKCPAGEQWDTSTAHCQTNCTTLGQTIPCKKIKVAGCVCKKDTYRDKNGECVPKNQCSEIPAKPYCPANEFFSPCIGHCEPDCKNKNKTLKDCNLSICVSECKCRWGFVRGPKGDCIKPEKCPANDKTKYPVKRQCPAKEQWELMKAHCQTNCTTIGQKIPCNKMAVAGCVCKKDTYRAKNGECVPKKQCPKKSDEWDSSIEDSENSSTEESEISFTEEPSWVDRDDANANGDEDEDEAKAKSYCPPNEFFASCVGHCEPDCKHKNKTLLDCDKSICVSECKCQWGFVRGPQGVCIKPDKCPANDHTKYPVKRKCPAKEQWELSKAHCQANCTTLGEKIPCKRIAVAGCVCKKGTYRAKNGECVPKKECHRKPGDLDSSIEDSEFSSTEDYEKSYTEEFSWIDRDDENGDEDDDDAKAKSYCPPNEFFASCVGHCEPDCKHKNKTLLDCDKSICVSECKCQWGFVRGPDGVCIKPDKCPANDKTKYPVKRKCPAKEQWEFMKAHCQTNCTTIGQKIPCKKMAVAGCVCKKDTYRAKNGECVPKKQCPKKSDDHEDSWNQSEDLSTDSSDIDEEYYGEKEDAVLEGPGGCPREKKCIQYCRSQGQKHGRCVGRHRRRCTCRR